jgi:DNA-binding response OmpR family regulator
VADLGLPPALLADYVSRLVIVRAEIEGHLAANSPADREALRRIAHQLRGSGAAYGHPQVTSLAAVMEEASPEALSSAARRLIEHLLKVAPGTAPRILVASDDPALVKLLQPELSATAGEVVLASSALEADALIAKARVDLILLDLTLPGSGGPALLGRWREAPATEALPIYALTAAGDLSTTAECYRLGVDGCFEKPPTPETLVAAVKGKLRRTSGAAQRLSAATPAPAPEPRFTPTPNGAPKSARILLAEDDPLIASIVLHRMGIAGHRVEKVGDGAAALAAIEAERPDLLILDVKMPELDGLGVLRRLRDDPATRNIPVILLTTLREEEDIVRGFALGANDYLVKPFSPTELAARVDRMLRTS